MVLYICYNIKKVPYMNDLFNNNIKPKNTEELYYTILKIVTNLYDEVVNEKVKTEKIKINLK